MKLKKIIVGMDERELARHAVEVGLDLSRKFDAELELVHTVPAVGKPWTSIPAARYWTEVRESVLEDARDRCAKKLESWFNRTEGDPSRGTKLADHLFVIEAEKEQGLHQRAEETHADLIVLGGHQRSGLLDFGRTAFSVLHGASCPVWIQSEPVSSAIKKILVPVDPNEVVPSMLEYIRDLAKPLQASLTLLHCFVPPDFAYEPLHSQTIAFPMDEVLAAERKKFAGFASDFDWKGVAVERRFVEGEAATQILALQDEYDLTAMATHGRSTLGRMVMGSVAYTVLKHTHQPVLTLPIEKAPAPSSARKATSPEPVAK